jgi:ArsR family transcriptional regulator
MPVHAKSVGAGDLRGLAKLFEVLADGTRLRVLFLLGGGEKNVTELTAALNVPQPTASHHLALLRTGGLVANRRSGKNVYYRLQGDAVACEACALVVTLPENGIQVRLALLSTHDSENR